MRRFLLTLFAVLLMSSAFSQRLWVKDGYIRFYNPTSKQDFFTLMQSISRIYIKGNAINVYTFSPSADFSIDYTALTQYNGGTVPSLATIGTALANEIHAVGWYAKETDVATNDSVLAATTYYSVPIPSTHVWNMSFQWSKNDDSVSFIPLISANGIRTLYPGLDTVITTAATGTISFDDAIFSGDTLIFKVTSTDTLVLDRVINKLSK